MGGGLDSVKAHVNNGALYYLAYSANNWENADYGVAARQRREPHGPWKKFAGNPILAKDPAPMYSTGHGSIARSSDGSQACCVHHGRPSDAAGRASCTPSDCSCRGLLRT